MDETIDISVYLRDVKTGETGVHKAKGYFQNGKFVNYIWTEGNYSCDCNRSAFLGCNELPCNLDANVIAIDKITRTDTGEVLIENI